MTKKTEEEYRQHLEDIGCTKKEIEDVMAKVFKK